jgi:hypothetical protein
MSLHSCKEKKEQVIDPVKSNFVFTPLSPTIYVGNETYGLTLTDSLGTQKNLCVWRTHKGRRHEKIAIHLFR